MFLPIAKDIWDAIQQTYSKAKDVAQVYEVEVKTSQSIESLMERTRSLYSNSNQML